MKVANVVQKNDFTKPLSSYLLSNPCFFGVPGNEKKEGCGIPRPSFIVCNGLNFFLLDVGELQSISLALVLLLE